MLYKASRNENDPDNFFSPPPKLEGFPCAYPARCCACHRLSLAGHSQGSAPKTRNTTEILPFFIDRDKSPDNARRNRQEKWWVLRDSNSRPID